MTIKCPTCRKPVEEDAPDFPFCSERCRLLDLGAWASGKYVISTPLKPEEVPEAEDPEQKDG